MPRSPRPAGSTFEPLSPAESGDAADAWLAEHERDEDDDGDLGGLFPLPGREQVGPAALLGALPLDPGTPAMDGPGSVHADAEIAAYAARARASAFEGMPALSAFQRRMDAYPQLSDEAEQELVADYQRGRAAEATLAGGARGRTERQALDAVRRGERAKEHLAGSMFRLVLLIAREQAEARHGRERALDLLPDLVGEANVALVEAMSSYDPARCPTFHIYAGRLVRDRVRMMLANDTPMRVRPAWARLKRIAAVRIPQLHVELGRTPTREEVQAALLERCMEWARDRLTPDQQALPTAQREQAALAKLRKQGMIGAIERIDEVLVSTQSVASLDSPVGEDGGSTLGDLIADGGQDMLAEVASAELSRDVAAALGSLSERERTILLHRFGFVDGQEWTYAKIATLFDVTPERIRQIEKSVLGKLRAPNAQSSRLAAHLPSQWDHDTGTR